MYLQVQRLSENYQSRVNNFSPLPKVSGFPFERNIVLKIAVQFDNVSGYALNTWTSLKSRTLTYFNFRFPLEQELALAEVQRANMHTFSRVCSVGGKRLKRTDTARKY